MNNTIILWASSRTDGETYNSVKQLKTNSLFTEENLGNLNISYYDYNHNNIEDDFVSLCEKILEYQNIVFATPVYWYAMCAQMKIFFDRTSDLITVKKEIGRRLSGKNTYLIANGTGECLPEGFEVPFKRTSNYFDMSYKGSLYLHTGKDEDLKQSTWGSIDEFQKLIINGENA